MRGLEGFALGGSGGFFDPASGADKYAYIAKRAKIEQLTYIPGEDDPAEVILKALGNVLDDLPEIYGSRILVATAPTPVGKSSILRPQAARDKEVEEGRWQGKVGIILKLGTTAFECDPRYPSYEWKGPKPKVGQWIYYRTSDAWETGLVNGDVAISARHIWDSDVVGRLENIETVY
jgi:hypothetical protein